jgi:hypothetical protein
MQPFTSTYGQTKVKILLRSSISNATNATYDSGWKAFNSYCLLTQCSPWQPSDAIIIGFIAHLTLPRHNKPTGLSIPTLKAYLSAINHYQTTWGYPNVLTERPLVERAVRGFKRMRGTPSKSKHPITIDLLNRIYKHINAQIKSHILCWCISITRSD